MFGVSFRWFFIDGICLGLIQVDKKVSFGMDGTDGAFAKWCPFKEQKGRDRAGFHKAKWLLLVFQSGLVGALLVF